MWALTQLYVDSKILGTFTELCHHINILPIMKMILRCVITWRVSEMSDGVYLVPASASGQVQADNWPAGHRY